MQVRALIAILSTLQDMDKDILVRLGDKDERFIFSSADGKYRIVPTTYENLDEYLMKV